MIRVFENIPEEQLIRNGWGIAYRELAERGRETTWGLRDKDKRLLALCVMLEEAQEQVVICTERGDHYLAAKKELTNKVKGLQLEMGRYKKQIGDLNIELLKATANASTEQTGS